MKKTSQQMITRFNTLLETHNQKIRLIEYTRNSVLLSSGILLENDAKRKFCKRIVNNKTNLWITNVDKLLSGEITEQEIKSRLSSIGGKSVQQQYGNLIRKNLNTGVSWNAGTKGQRTGTLSPRTQLVKDKISAKNSADGNGMFGTTMSDADKQMRSDKMKELILQGKFTPNSNNRNTHWDATHDGKKYRSSWEALYQFINPSAEYETLRIKYVIDNTTKIYIVDFIDYINKIVVEVKPRELCVGNKFESKMVALTNWANANSYSILIADAHWLTSQLDNIDYTRFDNSTALKLISLYETNKKN